MKLLLDENLPRRLKSDFQEHEIFTVREKGWNGFTNGELLKLMVEDDFDVLLTFDKNLQHQQNFSRFQVAVFLLTAESNQYRNLIPLVPKIRDALNDFQIGVTVIS